MPIFGAKSRAKRGCASKLATLEPSCDLSKLEQIAIITEYNVQ